MSFHTNLDHAFSDSFLIRDLLTLKNFHYLFNLLDVYIEHLVNVTPKESKICFCSVYVFFLITW